MQTTTGMNKPQAHRRRTKVISTALAIASAMVATSAMAASQTWTGVAGDGIWSTGGNWSGGAMPGVINPPLNGLSNDVATFNGAVGTVSPIIFDSLLNVASLLF